MKQQLLLLFTRIVSLGLLEADKPLRSSKPVYVTVKTTMGILSCCMTIPLPYRDNLLNCVSPVSMKECFHRTYRRLCRRAEIRQAKRMNQVSCMAMVIERLYRSAEILPNHFNKRGALIDATAATM